MTMGKKTLDSCIHDLRGAGVIPSPVNNNNKLSDLDRAYSDMNTAIAKAGRTRDYPAIIQAYNTFSAHVKSSPLMNDQNKGKRYREFEKNVSQIIKNEVASINKLAATAASTPAAPSTPPLFYSPNTKSEKAVSNIGRVNESVANKGNAIRGAHTPSIPSKAFAQTHLSGSKPVLGPKPSTPPVLKATVDPSMINRPKGSAPPVPARSARVIPPAPPRRDLASLPKMNVQPKAVTQPVNMQRPPEMKLPHGTAPINNAGKAIPIPQGRNAQDLAKKLSTPTGPAMKAKDLGPVVGPKILPTKPSKSADDMFSRDISADLFNRKSSLSASASPSEPTLPTSSAATSLDIKPPVKVVESVTREDIQARADAMKNAIQEVRKMSDNYLDKMSDSFKSKNPRAEAKFKSFNKQLDKFVNAIEKVADRNSNSLTGNNTIAENKEGLDKIQKYMRDEISYNRGNNGNANGRSEPFDSMLKAFEAKSTVPNQNVQQESRLRNRG